MSFIAIIDLINMSSKSSATVTLSEENDDEIISQNDDFENEQSEQIISESDNELPQTLQQIFKRD